MLYSENALPVERGIDRIDISLIHLLRRESESFAEVINLSNSIESLAAQGIQGF